ncbi:Rab-GTPase-TBC domain [Phytophthora infestans]|uniref:Rab-GTPase-TBC domain n=1 Tax=Phytophthora infestans TaxID=4787 RepID=A0A833WER7_PHYIN|nr:Rab-GTPase-TBC domain [Phytophthora infestans]KAF4137738.1 Rab-GTPase-TBC domain [Phytophthora infestans]
MSASTEDVALDANIGEVLPVLIHHRWVDIDTVEAVATTSKTLWSLVGRKKLRRLAVRVNGFPIGSRFRYWLRAGDVSTLMKKVPDGVSRREFYLKLANIESLEDSATLETTGVEGEIDRDIERTFPTNLFFSEDGDGKRLLGNVLKAVALYADDVGYCQGMNYVVAALLLVMKDAQEVTDTDLDGLSTQEAAFWLTLALIRRKGMAELWKHKMPGLSQCIYLFQQLLKLHFYDLSAHFRHIGMHSSILVTQWFVTIFARVLALPTLVRVWDLVLLDGWKAVYRVALAITAELRPKLLAMDLEQCSEFFRKNPKLGLEEVLSSDVLLQRAMSCKVTRSSLQQLEEERHLEYLRLRLQQTPLSEEHRMLFPTLEHEDVAAKKKSLELIRSKLQRFDTDVASDTVFLQHKIELAEKAQATAMSVRYAIAYELSEAAIELNERLEIKNRLRSKFRKLMATAITEATTSSSSSSSGFSLWMNPFDFLNERMASCFERLPLISSYLDTDTDDEEDIEAQQNLKHLDMLVPQLAAELRLLQRSLAYNERLVRPLVQRTRRLQRDAQLARVEVEETQLFKDRLADQLLQIMLTSEKLKNERMQQLFAEVDRNKL